MKSRKLVSNPALSFAVSLVINAILCNSLINWIQTHVCIFVESLRPGSINMVLAVLSFLFCNKI